MSDVDLVTRARHGDPAAFGELVEQHRSAVYRAALAVLGSPADAEDAAQDAFLLAYRRLDSFRGDASFKTWLLTITWHQAINRRRSLTRIWRRMVTPRTEQEAEAAMAGIAAAGAVARTGCRAGAASARHPRGDSRAVAEAARHAAARPGRRVQL